MMTATLQNKHDYSALKNEDFCNAAIPQNVYSCDLNRGRWGVPGGCLFKVGGDIYFVPTLQVANDDLLYITCDAQKLEGSPDTWSKHLPLGDVAQPEVEDAIVEHLQESRMYRTNGESFVIMRGGKTYRL